MKKVIKIWMSCIITLVLTVGIIYKLGELVRPINTDIALNAINTFHDMPEETIEVIGYGSSHMWRGMDPLEMYEKYGIGAYNYGCNWQRINTTELFLKDSLLTQSPKVVLIETYLVNSVLQDTNITGEIYYTRGISEFEGKKEYLKQCFGDDKERYLSYYMPLCAFHDNWVNLVAGNFSESADNTDFYATMGFFSKSGITPVTIGDPSTFVQKELSDAAIEVLDEMVDICNQNDAKIIFYTAPYAGNYEYGDAMQNYAASNGCVYLNLFEYMDELEIDCETDFDDPTHLNDSGSAKVADFLGSYIVNHYDVTDIRTIKENIWEKNMKRGKERE